MPTYRLDVLERPKEGHPVEHYQQHHTLVAADDAAAIDVARKRYNRLVCFTPLDHFVLYEDERVVHEFVTSARE